MHQNSSQDFWTKIFVIEKDILENQKSINKLDSSYQELIKKLENLKDDIKSKKNIDDFEDRIKDLEEMVDSLRQEMPEMRLIKKMFFALVAFVLMSFLGLIWNNVIFNSTKNNSTTNFDNSKELAKKVIEEYNKDKGSQNDK